MNTYLVKMKPLEPYAFGTDMRFKFPDDVETGKESYIARSNEIPEQTTILGMLRFLLLDQHKIVKSDFKYDMNERRQIVELIGKESFRFSVVEKQNFGRIKSVSPLFILDERFNIYVKKPFQMNNVTWHFIEMESEEYVTSSGTLQFPMSVDNKFDSGYIRLMEKPCKKSFIGQKDLFQHIYQVGNRKSRQNIKNEQSDQDNKEKFFKQEYISLKEGFSFGVYVECEGELPAKTIERMGQKSSAFLIETQPETNCLEFMVQKTFEEEKDRWYYALSDIYCNQGYNYDTYCIVKGKSVRNLESVMREDGRLRSRKTNIQYHLISSGSVFYKTFPLKLTNENALQIGYNHIIEIGGKI